MRTPGASRTQATVIIQETMSDPSSTALSGVDAVDARADTIDSTHSSTRANYLTQDARAASDNTNPSRGQGSWASVESDLDKRYALPSARMRALEAMPLAWQPLVLMPALRAASALALLPKRMLLVTDGSARSYIFSRRDFAHGAKMYNVSSNVEDTCANVTRNNNVDETSVASKSGAYGHGTSVPEYGVGGANVDVARDTGARAPEVLARPDGKLCCDGEGAAAQGDLTDLGSADRTTVRPSPCMHFAMHTAKRVAGAGANGWPAFAHPPPAGHKNTKHPR